MNILNFKHFAVAVLSCAALQFGLVSCSDDPGVENYYTSTSQYATDYLLANGQFSEYTKILERATGEKGTLRLLQLLGSYGSYTVLLLLTMLYIHTSQVRVFHQLKNCQRKTATPSHSTLLLRMPTSQPT